MGSLLDPVADKVLVLAVLIVLVGRDVFPGWMVAAIVGASSSSRAFAWLPSNVASS
jgi:phosphatidylglycerophosphate synthase